MTKLIAVLLGMIATFMTGVFLVMFVVFFGGTIAWLIWNHLMPIYFTSILPAQFIHIPWWHGVLFVWLVHILFGGIKASTSK